MRAVFAVLLVFFFLQTFITRETSGGLPQGGRDARMGCHRNCKHFPDNRCNTILPDCCPKKKPSCSPV
uniref:SLPTX10 n=1 Tax=Scolopendra viridis TaxID=118503 RepID=A0A4D5R9X2_SCOVI